MLLNRPDRTIEQLNRTSSLMDRAIPDAIVTGHEDLIAGLTLPDPDDRHVLAAAIRCNASVIVTFNEKDFPAEALSHYAMETQHPDVFAENRFDLDHPAVIAAAQRQRQQLKHPPVGVDEFLETLLRQGLVQTSKSLANYRAIL